MSRHRSLRLPLSPRGDARGSECSTRFARAAECAAEARCSRNDGRLAAMWAPTPAFGLLVSFQFLTPQRWWLERLAILVPGSAATRWLLVADAVCLVALGLSSRHPWLGVPLALGAGFLVLNLLGMAL